MYDSNRLQQRHKRDMRRLDRAGKAWARRMAAREKRLEKLFRDAVSAKILETKPAFDFSRLALPDPVTIACNVALGAVLLGFFAIMQ